MSSAIKLSSALFWYLFAILFIAAAPYAGFLDGVLFPPVDRSKTSITIVDESEGRTVFEGVFFRNRSCLYKGVEFFRESGVLMDAKRIGPVVEAVLGWNEFGPWATSADAQEVLCGMKAKAEYACYGDNPFHTYVTFYDGSENTDPICKRNSQ